ncbi:MAG: hypothetical protein ACI9TV_000645 [Sulfurimonas sp.]|jgi:hypothetical protein|uniref:hypothetical protein n=1 Tax=Sulfurimonas sp. TaxID=2022749 RepID=UPI0039E37291
MLERFVISYLYDEPTCVFTVENGEAVSAGFYSGKESDWDMRASPGDWMKWVAKPFGMTGIRYSTYYR